MYRGLMCSFQRHHPVMRGRVVVVCEGALDQRDWLVLVWLQIWSSNHLFPSAEEATLFLGTLDTIFLFSYAVVSFRTLGFYVEEKCKITPNLMKLARDFEFADWGEFMFCVLPIPLFLHSTHIFWAPSMCWARARYFSSRWGIHQWASQEKSLPS